MLYFAYGSNMDWEQMRARCPSARFAGIACLRNHKLAFTRRSRKRACGVADVIPADGGEVWGAVFEVEDRDVGALDLSEGFVPGREPDRNCYLRVERHVYPPESAEPWAVWTYVANRQENPPPPSADYLNLIVRAAEHWHLPAAHVNALSEVEVAE